jgi:hypothetical protein
MYVRHTDRHFSARIQEKSVMVSNANRVSRQIFEQCTSRERDRETERERDRERETERQRETETDRLTEILLSLRVVCVKYCKVLLLPKSIKFSGLFQNYLSRPITLFLNPGITLVLARKSLILQQ